MAVPPAPSGKAADMLNVAWVRANSAVTSDAATSLGGRLGVGKGVVEIEGVADREGEVEGVAEVEGVTDGVGDADAEGEGEGEGEGVAEV